VRPDVDYCVVEGDYVAFQVFGTGPDLLFQMGFMANADALWAHPVPASFLRSLGRFARVIMFDRRGSGASDRPTTPVTWESYVEDAVAVLDATSSSRAALYGAWDAAAVSVLLAATLPQRVDRLALYVPVISGARYSEEDLAEIVARWGRPYQGLATNEDVRWITAAHQRASASPKEAAAAIAALSAVDAAPFLRLVHQPVLILRRPDNPAGKLVDMESLMTGLPRAQLLDIGGVERPLWWEGDDALSALRAFLDGDVNANQRDRQLGSVMFVDIVDSTGRLAEVGDQRWAAMLDHFQESTRPAVSQFGGRVITSTGDGFLAVFELPTPAVRAALHIHASAASLGLSLRTGIHVGEVERRGTDVAGHAVHVAARLQGAAAPGEILVSAVLRDLVRGSDLQFDDRAAKHLKGLDGTWTVFAAVP